MIGCLRTCVHKQQIIALYFEVERVAGIPSGKLSCMQCLIIVVLASITHGQMLPRNYHADIARKARGQIFGPSLFYIHTSCMQAAIVEVSTAVQLNHCC